MAIETENISEDSFIRSDKADLLTLGTPEDDRRHLNSVALRTYSGQKRSTKGAIEDHQITELLPMVHRIVRQVVTYLRPPLSFEDMVSAGAIGLVKASHDFDPSRHTEFKTYAYIRIKGAVIDELRGSSWLPVNLNKRIRRARQLSRKILEQTGTNPTDAELAQKLGITIEELSETFEIARAQYFVSLDGFEEDSLALSNLLAETRTSAPDKQIERAELIDKLAEAIQQLSRRKRQLILLYYQQHLTMKQIAEIFEITESRVSQLHASAIFNLSVKLRHWKDGRL
ncbi:MAG: FliA/WhiG family RNA polymerase sigma factor [Planctomycetes bacterium]|nr:FliA/WhiG family RNA polymerase sigma factor [Planctomycetota bacterium]